MASPGREGAAPSDATSSTEPVLQNQANEPGISSSMRERRVANDGHHYVFADFVEHYADRAQEKWDQAAPGRHNVAQLVEGPRPPWSVLQNYTPEYRTAENGKAYVFADFVRYYDDRALEKWDRATPTKISFQKWAHAQDSNIKLSHPSHSVSKPVVLPLEVLLDRERAQQLRQETTNKGCRKAMRNELNRIASAEDKTPTTLSFPLDCREVPWMEYLAHHEKNNEIIGTGIVRFVAQFMPNITDPNRRHQLRLNFIAQRSTGECVMMHLGSKAGQDAAIRVFPTMADAVEAPEVHSTAS